MSNLRTIGFKTGAGTTTDSVGTYQLYHGTCWASAFITISGGAATIRASFNVASVTYVGVGQAYLTLTEPIPASFRNCIVTGSQDNAYNAGFSNGARIVKAQTSGSNNIYLSISYSTQNTYLDGHIAVALYI